MTWMKHIDRIEANGIGTGLHMAGRRLHRGIHRVIGSVSSHVRHNVSSTAVAKRNDVPARDLTPLPGAFFGVLAAMMIGYLLLTSIAKALYVHAHGELL